MTEHNHTKKNQNPIITDFITALSEVEDFYGIKYILLAVTQQGSVRVHKFVSMALKLEEERRPKRIEMKKEAMRIEGNHFRSGSRPDFTLPAAESPGTDQGWQMDIR